MGSDLRWLAQPQAINVTFVRLRPLSMYKGTIIPSFSTFHFRISASVLITIFSFKDGYNATADQNNVVCVYPLSGQYEALQRFLYYALLLFAVFARNQVWLVSGALASALTYSGTAAIHAIVLATVSRNSLLDLDSFGTWAILSAGCLVMLPFAEFSSTLRESPTRPLFKFWGLLVMIGTVCSAVACLRKYPEEPACRSSDEVLLSSPNQRNVTLFNCTYTCFATVQPLRSTSEITVLMTETLLGKRGNLFLAVVLIIFSSGVIIGVLAGLGSGRKQTEAELLEAIGRIDAYLSSPSSYNNGTSGGFGSGGDPRETAREEKELLETELRTGHYQHPPGIVSLGVLNCLLFVVIILLNELCIFLSGGLPFSEPAYAVGQWSAWVSTILVLIASAITQHYLPTWEERQKILKREKEAREARRTLESGAQQTPIQQHVPTAV